MMSLHALVYCSNAVSGLTLAHIDHLARDAAAHNLIAGVTGVLLTDGNKFLQYIEGPEDGLSVAYARICDAKSHTGIVELARSVGGPRRFPYWRMRWLPVEPEDLRIAKLSDWRGLVGHEEVTMFQVPTGIDRVNRLIDPYQGVDLPDWWGADAATW
jgi:hypothetical protein